MKANRAELMSHRQRTASKYYRVVNRNKTSTKQETGETPIQFLTRLDNYLLHWIELARAEKSFEGIKALVVQQQYLSTCPKEIAMHPKEGKPTTIRELGEKSLKNYVKAHATDIVFGIEPRQHRIRSLQSDMRRCHNCLLNRLL